MANTKTINLFILRYFCQKLYCIVFKKNIVFAGKETEAQTSLPKPGHDYSDGEDGGSSEVGGEDYSMDAPTIKPGYICLGFFLLNPLSYGIWSAVHDMAGGAS